MDVEEYYREMLTEAGFCRQKSQSGIREAGEAYCLPEASGHGGMWIYGQKNYYDIKTHDFSFSKDETLEFRMPECLSITYYESIRGVETDSGRRLESGCVMAFIGGEKNYRIRVDGKVPVRSVGIEIWPDYYRRYLKENYPEADISYEQIFRKVGITKHFPQMVSLLKQVREYSGRGLSARLFYEAKVAEALALLMEFECAAEKNTVDERDCRMLRDALYYADRHLNEDITIARLSQISCMGETKFKEVFKHFTGMSMLKYLQKRRMERAAALLRETDESVGEIAAEIGYSNAGRFSELFKREYGDTPRQYRMRQRGK